MNSYRPRKRHFIIVTLLSFFLCCIVSAQGMQDSIIFRPEVERLFVEAMKYFQSGKFDSASLLFTRTMHDFPRSHRTTGAYIMDAKALYEIKDYKESIRLLKDLIDLFPQSNYIDDAHYTLGLNYYRTGRYEDAASEFLTVRTLSHKPILLTRSEKMSDMLMSSYLTISELQLLEADTKNDETKAHVRLRLAEKVYRTGDVGTTQEILQKVTAMSPTIRYVGDALTFLDQIQKKGVMKLGIVHALDVDGGKSFCA